MQLHSSTSSPFPERLVLPFSNDDLFGYEELDSSGTDLFRGSKSASTKSWSNIWLISIRLQQIFAKHQKGNLLHILSQTVPANALRPVRLCRGDSASTTGTLDPVGDKKLPSNNKLQEGGIPLPCRKHLIMLITMFVKNDFTCPTMRAARFSSAGSPSTPASMSSHTRRDLLDHVLEGEQGWVLEGVLSRAIFRHPPVSGQMYVTVLYLHIRNIYAKKKGIAKFTLTLRAVMIS